MRLIVATNNAGKLEELRGLLPTFVDLVTMSEAGLDSPDETGELFLDNAMLKAHSAAPFADGAIADDSGLEVAALDGAPGVRSARYSGLHASDEDNNRALLQALDHIPDEQRRARFVSCVVLEMKDGRRWHAEGSISGSILRTPRGCGGFGYDPLFEIDDPCAGEFNRRTVAELRREDKNQVSHRARAYQALLKMLNEEQVWQEGEVNQ